MKSGEVKWYTIIDKELKIKYASIITYYNDDNLLCNKVFIKELNKINLPLNEDCEPIDSWLDVRTELGFIREYNKKKYYYDKFNNLINVEVYFTSSQFPLYKKDKELNNKIGTIDLETYGSNFGLGYHQVYAAGFSIKGKTELYYIELGENSDDFVNKIFFNIFMSTKDLDGHTFYVHNLGKFDSIFILKALTKNNEFTVTPIYFLERKIILFYL